MQPDDEAVVRRPRPRPSSRQSTTCGCGSTSAARPQRRAISRAAPGVSVTSASARCTSTPSWAAWSPGSGWWGLRRSCTVTTSGAPAASSASATARSSSGGLRVEPEVDVEHVERAVVRRRPSPRRASPAATSRRAPVRRRAAGRRAGARRRRRRADRSGGGRRRGSRAPTRRGSSRAGRGSSSPVAAEGHGRLPGSGSRGRTRFATCRADRRADASHRCSVAGAIGRARVRAAQAGGIRASTRGAGPRARPSARATRSTSSAGVNGLMRRSMLASSTPWALSWPPSYPEA